MKYCFLQHNFSISSDATFWCRYFVRNFAIDALFHFFLFSWMYETSTLAWNFLPLSHSLSPCTLRDVGSPSASLVFSRRGGIHSAHFHFSHPSLPSPHVIRYRDLSPTSSLTLPGTSLFPFISRHLLLLPCLLPSTLASRATPGSYKNTLTCRD